MPATFEDALTYARGLGAGFTVEALRERYGGSARDNAELVRRVKVELAAEAARERHQRLEAAQIPDTVRSVIDALIAAVGEATLHLQDALLVEHDRMSRAVADAMAAADRRAEQTLAAERDRQAASRAAADAEATQREAILKAELANASQELTTAKTELAGLRGECERLRQQLAETTETVAALRQRAERSEADVAAARDAAAHSRDMAELAKREREGYAGELRATQTSLRSAEAQIAQLLELLAQPRSGAGQRPAEPHTANGTRDTAPNGAGSHGMTSRGHGAPSGPTGTFRPKQDVHHPAQDRR